MQLRDFLGRARWESLKEKIETRQSAAEASAKRNAMP
jgi:hypothetical protein